ncbi:MAG TPA: methyltransferase, partial [Candidatus Aminicenantes bacterium]|nr:methyltransferase [Candidatus Aminicenantes bacterium]
IDGLDMEFITDERLFSPGGPDRGTLAMLSEARFAPGRRVLDLGCGWGLVGVYAALRVGEENVVIDDFYSGTTAYDDFANLMMAVNYFLLNNRERTVRIQKIDVELNGMETMRRTELENVLINKAAFLPGEAMELELQLQNDRGQATSDKITLKAPNLPPGTEFYLMAADAQEMVDFDTKVIKTAYFPAQLAPLIRALNNLRRSNRIYFKLYMPTEGFFLRGYEYANPPKSMANVFVYGSQSRDQSDMLISTITEYQYEVPAAVSGKKVFRLKIKERKNES